MPTAQFRAFCETVWPLLMRDQELLSYSYTCLYVSPKGEKLDAARRVFTVRGLFTALSVRPKGYCTLRLLSDSSSGRGEKAEIIDLRSSGKIVTDDGGYLTVRRRSMSVDWYREMPRILEFCDYDPAGRIEVRCYEA